MNTNRVTMWIWGDFWCETSWGERSFWIRSSTYHQPQTKFLKQTLIINHYRSWTLCPDQVTGTCINMRKLALSTTS